MSPSEPSCLDRIEALVAAIGQRTDSNDRVIEALFASAASYQRDRFYENVKAACSAAQ
ncbi:MAG: hypothetical protein ACFB4I_04540 [Cyanophyceae cyanobacterium]